MADRKAAIKELEDISRQLQDVIDQLKISDTAYYCSPEVASCIAAIPGLQWGVGKDPRDGAKRFTAYFQKF